MFPFNWMQPSTVDLLPHERLAVWSTLGSLGLRMFLTPIFSSAKRNAFYDSLLRLTLGWIHANCNYDIQNRPVTRQTAAYNSSVGRSNLNNSYANSIGPGGRPPSRSAHTRTPSVRSAAPKNGRPVTSMGVRTEEPTKNSTSSHQCFALPPKSSRIPTKPKKIRKWHSVSDMGAKYIQPLPTPREASICQGFESLHISENGARPSLERWSPVVPGRETPPPKVRLPTDVTVRHRGQSGAKLSNSVPELSRDDPVVPMTPTYKELMQQFARTESSYKAVQTPMMSPSPTKSTFLTKDSNLPNFVAWDVDERLGTFESEFKAMKEMINTSISGQKSLEDNMSDLQKKSKSSDLLLNHSRRFLTIFNSGPS